MIAAMVLVLSVLVAALPAMADGAAGAAPQSSAWIISTRGAPSSGQVDSSGQRIAYWRLNADNRWLCGDADGFFRKDDRPLPTTIFVHGNRSGQSAAISNGWQIYCQIKRQAAGRPFRFVIWSWPSDRIRGRPRRDVRVKACRSDVQSYYLAQCLRRVDQDVPVSMVGYSFGARVITGALHMLAGGRVAGRSLPQQPEAESDAEGQSPRRRAILVAAAMDADWLMPGHRNGLALSQVERLLVTRNRCDPVLRWYPLMYRRGGPQALGFVGPAGCTRADKIELLDVSCSVGRIHDWARYVAAAGLRHRLAQYAFIEPSKPEAASETPIPPDGSAQ